MMTILIPNRLSSREIQSGSDQKTVEQIDTKLSGNRKSFKRNLKAKLRYIKQNFEKIFANEEQEKLFLGEETHTAKPILMQLLCV